MDFDLTELGCFAVVGATRDPEKYGYKVLMDLHHGGYRVYGVNPNYREIEGVECFPDIQSLPRVPDLLILVVPPEVTERVVEEAARLGVKRIWMQPGAESPRAIAFCRERGIEAVHDACIMVYRREVQGGGKIS
ncbi:MAG: CoA-binding protein [Actinobacteria bacterium]|nr:CoA-binding protein [Actinomycetota bacterium]